MHTGLMLTLLLKSSAAIRLLPLPVLKVAALPLLGSTVVHFAVVVYIYPYIRLYAVIAVQSMIMMHS
jgi:hypothetical protein